ncbi:MAG: D-glycero-beta-D-manno-heptose-7-phosphate kinase [Selenomonadaceae bacterium]|nr:D-glycero-beta-D-manno-heptose-7-phosphate kinase [Selenomonadaceae bacterium]MBQ6757642.1 D-glycero-beta-D-manno-heptose-7-phosphate kinase [Selenomonadaceae bacterium]MBR0103410.1 D-glycero-beta-D-manno-heptose-7-phosphate kinase [Selenomonadaceae bacterium]
MIDELKSFVADGISSCKVLVVGDVMLDKYYFGEVTRISPEAPVPIARVLKVKETLGGAANVVHNLALLGCQTSIIGQVGRDNHGEIFLGKLKALGVDYSGMIETSKPTTTKIRVISGHQQMIRLDFEDTGELDTLATDELLKNFSASLPNVDGVIVSDYGKGVCTKKICREIIGACRAAKKFVVVDPKGDNWQKYFDATFITPNLKELNAVLPKRIPNVDAQIEEAAQKVIDEFNLRGLVVTRSAEGLSLIDGDKVSHIKARAQEVFDVSGAGDTVIAVFALALAGKIDSAAAAYLANVAAGVVVAKVGTYAVNREELLNAL